MFREFIVPNDNETDDKPAFCHECQSILKSGSKVAIDLEDGVMLCLPCHALKEIHRPFLKGNRLFLRKHKSLADKGLSYDSQVVIALEDGISGGWDVYDAQTLNGREISFYGFSIEEIH